MKPKNFFAKQLNNLKDIFKDRTYAMIFFSLALFFILNAFKIAVFNFYILPRQSLLVFIYKCIYSLLVILIFYPFIIKLKSRAIFIIFYLLQVLYILVNISYYLYFRNYLHINGFISLFTEGFTAVTRSAASINPVYAVFLIDLPIFIYIMIKYDKIPTFMKKFQFFVAIIIIISICGLSILECYNYKRKKSIVYYMSDMHGGESLVVLNYGTIVDNIINVFKNGDEAQMVSKFRYGKEQSDEGQSHEKPNIVIIQIESMDSNVINQKHNGSYIAPYLNSLSNNSVFYPYVLSYHMGGGTSDVEFSIINSIQPLVDFPAIKITNYNYPNSVVKQFDNASYNTLAFHGNVGNYYNRDVAFPKMGFNKFLDMNKMNLSPKGWGACDKDVFNFAANYLKTAKQPFYAYTITMTSHLPFTNVLNYYKNDNYNDIKNETVKNYFNSITYVDQSIKDFVTYVRNNFDNTYIFIWGDHTPNINTEEYKQASFTEADKYFEFVPMFIITPDNRIYREDKQAASFLDISLTMLNASGIKYNIKSDGVDILKTPETDSKIPFKDSSFDRSSLFTKIKDIHN